MTLQQLIRYTNAPAIEATWVDENDVIIKRHAYSNHPEQIAMLRADLGADAAQYESLIAEVEATYNATAPSRASSTCHMYSGPGAGGVVCRQGVTEADVSAAIAAIPESLVPEYGMGLH